MFAQNVWKEAEAGHSSDATGARISRLRGLAGRPVGAGGAPPYLSNGATTHRVASPAEARQARNESRSVADRRWTTENIPDQSGRVAIVTGANSGIGYETAKALAEKGAAVVLACRDEGRGTAALADLEVAAADAKAHPVLLDLASLASVKTFAETFLARFDRLDLLINNAGVMHPPMRQETEDGFELQLGVNHLGHFALTMLLVERLTATPDSRVVNVASSAQRIGRLDLDDLHWTRRRYRGPFAYGASKIANMLFTLELQRRFDEAGVPTTAVAAHPGWTATNLQATSPLIMKLNPILAMEPWQGALPTLYAAVADEAEPGGYYGPHGFGNWRGYPAPNRPSRVSTDRNLAARLWSISEDLVDIRCPDLEPEEAGPTAS